MTPDKPKCEHTEVLRLSNAPSPNLPWKDQWECFDCGLRFVPSDVLEEAAETIRELMLHPNGAYDEVARATLARIDGVLGK